MNPYTVKMRPYLREKVWGGRKLQSLYNKPLPADRPIGESWEVSDLSEGQSFAVNGPAAGKSLVELVELWGADLTGSGTDGQPFPLLVKVLDAQADLSVQVHPGEDDIERLGLDADSKDESWLILDVDPGGSILHGFDEATTADAFRQAIEEGRAADVLRRVFVEPGDVVRVTPGTIHAICEGVVLLEIQQPSDTTYRVFDYDRPGLDGKPRELHLDDAMAVARFEAHEPARLIPQVLADGAHELLVDAPAYRIERLRLTEPLSWTVDAHTPQVVFCQSGRVRLSSGDRGGGDEAVELVAGETAVVPACAQSTNASPLGGEARVVIAGRGGPRLVRPLASRPT